MRQLFFTLGNRKKIMAIPDMATYPDGQTVVNHACGLYLNTGPTSSLPSGDRENISQFKKMNHRSYLGTIVIDTSGSFDYSAGTYSVLNEDEIQEIIEGLADLQDNPAITRDTGT